jgi:hypothetical protein
LSRILRLFLREKRLQQLPVKMQKISHQLRVLRFLKLRKNFKNSNLRAQSSSKIMKSLSSTLYK